MDQVKIYLYRKKY